MILGVPKGLSLKNSKTLSLSVNVKVPENNTLKEAVIFGADYKGYSVEKTHLNNDGTLKFAVPEHGVATMIILADDIKKIKSLKNWTKFTENIINN